MDRRCDRGFPTWIGAASVLVLSSTSSLAHAGAFEVMGFGPEGIAAINARAARAEDGTAAFYNPAGLATGQGVALTIAPSLGISALSAQGKGLPLEDPFGVSLAFATTIPLEGILRDRLRFGFGAHFNGAGVLHLLSRPGDAPLFPYYDNRTQRLVLIPALAVRIADGLALGVGVNVLGGVEGPASVRTGASGAPESRLDLAATTTMAVNLGLRVDLAEHVRLGIAFRQRFAVPAIITTSSRVAGVPIDVTVRTESAMVDPTTLVLGSSFDLGHVTVEVDASYAVWSDYAGPYVFVRAELPGLDLSSSLPEGIGRDVVSLRGAAAYRFDLGPRTEVALHGGAGFEPTMLKSFQQGRTNLLDGPKALFGVGATWALRDVWALRALRFGAGLSAQVVLPYAQDKRICAAIPCPAETVIGPDPHRPSVGIQNPGFPRLAGQGTFLSASLGVGVDL